jgi:ATP-binding cassette subfamily C (CFTR/MRP) protein 4
MGNFEPSCDYTTPTISPYDCASFWSHTSFSYVYNLLVLGYSRQLLRTDLPPLPNHDDTTSISDKLYNEWRKEKRRVSDTLHIKIDYLLKSLIPHTQSDNKPPSLWMAIYRANRSEFWTAGFWTISEHAMMLLQPILLNLFLQFLVSSDQPISTGLLLSLSLFAVSFLQSTFHHQTYYTTMRAGWNLRISLTVLVHDKLLNLNLTSAASHGGVAMNLVSNDVFRFDNFMPAVWHYLTGPIDGVVILVLLSRQLNFLPAMAGILVVLFDVFLKLGLGH